MGKRDSRFHGVLLCNKPVGITSHDAVNIIRRSGDTRQVGHTGTLDPLAEGLLVVCVGRATKIAKYLTGLDKTYIANITLGLVSETYDSEGVDQDAIPADVSGIAVDAVQKVIAAFVGRQKQQVPAYSAVQVDGERLYKRARQGKETIRPEREITIHSIELLSFSGNTLQIEVSCSSGTYIRTLADDIGRELGCGAYLSGLKRTVVGAFSVSKATDVMTIKGLASDRSFGELLLSVEEALPLGAITVSEGFADKVIHGCKLSQNHIAELSGTFNSGDCIYLKSQQGEPLAVGRAGFSSSDLLLPETEELFRYDRVLN